MAKSDRVVVIGAGPVGLCLSLALAQDEIPVTLVETLGDDNFLEQVPRAGSNHPSTLEMFDRIGLYEKLFPRGIIAPRFQYWDRQTSSPNSITSILPTTRCSHSCCNASASRSSKKRLRWRRNIRLSRF